VPRQGAGSVVVGPTRELYNKEKLHNIKIN